MIQCIAEVKWRWAGHVAWHPNTKLVTRWRTRAYKRGKGRSQKRWLNDIYRRAGRGGQHMTDRDGN